MKTVRVSRGFLLLCDSCYETMRHDGVVDNHDQANDSEIIEDLCPNCHDYNKVLIDDLLGSSE